MLAAEEAHAALNSVFDQNWEAARIERVGRLKRRRRPVGQALIAPEPGWNSSDREPYFRRQLEAAERLDEMSPDDISAIMAALHPGLGPALARWWEAGRFQPYGSSWNRRSFRAPTRPDITRDRWLWDLKRIVDGAGPYDRPPEWFAAWVPHFDDSPRRSLSPNRLGPVLGAAIDAGGPSGDATLGVLIESGNGTHPVGGMGRHVIVGLMQAARPEGWDHVESLLRAAQRQEGLRQSILEAADEAHPQAFDRLIDVVLSEGLMRFAATVRAVGVWIGFREDVERIGAAEDHLRRLKELRADPAEAAAVARTGTAWDTYLGLCAMAQIDVVPAVEVAREVLSHPERDNRAAALRFVANAELPPALRNPIYLAATADPDLAVAVLAAAGLRQIDPAHASDEIYEALDLLVRRLSERPGVGKPVGIDPEPVPLDRGEVVWTLVRTVGDRPLRPLLDHLPTMAPYVRTELVAKAGKRQTLDPDVRAAVVTMVGDRSSDVRSAAVKAMESLAVDPSEAPELEALLTRKAGDLRRGIIALLAKLPEPEVLASVHRLWAGKAPQRDAAAQLLAALDETPAVVAAASQLLADGPSDGQREFLEGIGSADAPDADDPTLGLYDPADLTPPRSPRPTTKGRIFVDGVAHRIADALDDLAEAHRDQPFRWGNAQHSTEILLADARWLPGPFGGRQPEEGWGMILPEVFRTWWDDRPDECRGASEGLDALRSLVAVKYAWSDVVPYEEERVEWVRKAVAPLHDDGRLELRHPKVVHHVLEWLTAENADVAVLVECIDGAEAAMALIPEARLEELSGLGSDWTGRQADWRSTFLTVTGWFRLSLSLLRRDPMAIATDQLDRWYGLARWIDRPIPATPPLGVDTALLYAAHAVGVAGDADIYDHFISPERHAGREVKYFTRRRRGSLVRQHPTVVPLADRLRERVLELELTRGDLSTAASRMVFELGSVEGAEVTVELLARLGRASLSRASAWVGGHGREEVYSCLIQISHPAATDSPTKVAELVAHHKVSDKRLVELAMFAPQWAHLVEAVLGWEGLEDAVWWFHVHTKDDRWSVDEEVRETWAALSAERTPLSAADLTEGAVDVAWFSSAHERLGAERWTMLHKVAKLASGGSGHRRAQIFAEAMLGQLDEAALMERIRTKRHQDSLRALGLLPLPADDGATALARYGALREFERGAKKVGQQRQRSEATAVRMAVENLARTSGATDPQHFVWAMEAAEAADLAHGGVTVTVEDLTVTLSVDVEGQTDLAVTRGDKALKAVPAPLRKHPEIKELTERRTGLRRQTSRVRRSLEDAMVRQDAFSSVDLVALGRHPVVAPMLDLLVWVDESGATFGRREGIWVDVEGRSASPVGSVRLAHPIDLVGSGAWIDWQARFFDNGQRQPFKQVFRELYVLTGAEADASPFSRRWSGHQLQSRQASGLFTARGWVGDRDSGQVARTFHHAGLVARVSFIDGWGTPAEVELPTIDTVAFTTRGDHGALALNSIPPVVFSETMRDLDLVVSVAHAGGVDPEASASTVEMRAALVRETTRLLGLENVREVSSHVVIEGSLGEYSVHLGSGTVHRRPGGALCIIPVDAQRRGRLFLPFADDDPKTAEIVSKVVMLARDATIKDPTILEQLRS